MDHGSLELKAVISRFAKNRVLGLQLLAMATFTSVGW
jgi:hypothetical protein